MLLEQLTKVISPNIKKITQNSDNSSLAQNIASKLDDLVDGIKNSSEDLRKEVITELKSVSKSIKDLDKK